MRGRQVGGGQVSCRGVRPYKAYGRTYVSRCIPEVQERWKVENRSASGCGSGCVALPLSLVSIWALRCGGRPAGRSLDVKNIGSPRQSLRLRGVGQ